MILSAIFILLFDDEKKTKKEKKKRSTWIRPWLARREERGFYHQLLREISVEDSAAFHELLRVTKTQFHVLVDTLSPRLAKRDTVMRESIKPGEMCALALRFLATGESFRSLHFQFRLGRETISQAISEVCLAVYEEMGPIYVKTPNSRREWEQISAKFEERWNLPNILGAIDGKRIILEQPINSGSRYHDYKGNDSVILMAVVGPEYEFLNVDVGMNGRMSDGGNWSRNSFRKALENENNPLRIPPPKPLPGRIKSIPHVFVGDDAFGLSSYMMKPYPQLGLTEEKRIFNYRLSRCRRISENAFGILSSRWRVFRKPLLLQPRRATSITLAAITLHNWLRSETEAGQIQHLQDLTEDNGSHTEDNSWLNLEDFGHHNATQEAKGIRKEFTEYVMKEGTVPWQWRSAHIL